MYFKFIYSLGLFLLFKLNFIDSQSQRWSIDKAQKWYSQQGWLAGCNFIPSTAVNVLEMWQDDTFEETLQTTSIELEFAQSIGFNTIRVFLHYLLWKQDPVGFKNKINRFIDVVIVHHIRIIFVLFDDCWHDFPELGPQKPPIPGVHNSRWVQCPGQREVSDTKLYPIFKNYVQDIIKYFQNDPRILMWDVFNEPGNKHTVEEIFPLLSNVFTWAREVNSTQPLTSGVFKYTSDYSQLNQFQMNNSDIITFHDYENLSDFIKTVDLIQSQINGRPLICTEYMARVLESRFETHMPYMKSKYIGAINWGLVSGKTQTIYPWWSLPYSPPPKLWFHDIFNKDGSPFNQTEIYIIKNQTSLF